MKLNKLASYAAILGAMLFFILSTIRLINFAIVRNAIRITDSKIIEFVMNNYRTLNLCITLVLALTALIILFAYYEYTKNKKQKIAKYSIIAVTLALIVNSLSELSNYTEMLNFLNVKAEIIKITLAILLILFATALLFYKENRKKAILIIAPLYILQNIFILSTSLIPIQLLDLTVAIKIAEAAWLHQEN
ncbi:MAG TPA: hypothetical protein VJK51_04130 [Candidatus Nanoarchaeia archaeon]|nr:hypothetical protein [Candidatus Nanoarchaeia archaeon]